MTATTVLEMQTPAQDTPRVLVLPIPRWMASAPIVRELPVFWPKYLWHHRRPWTRRLHAMGSWACIAGAAAAIAYATPALVLGGLFVGYLLAFTGHWVVERNQPLSFGRPVLAGICNWIMFAYELGGRLELQLEILGDQAPDGFSAQEVGNE